jgi:hypothetical protein
MQKGKQSSADRLLQYSVHWCIPSHLSFLVSYVLSEVFFVLVKRENWRGESGLNGIF